MFSVIFETLPRKENWDDYLENAEMLRPKCAASQPEIGRMMALAAR
jgi:hypothetical protein